jgi:hypothetical protein
LLLLHGWNEDMAAAAQPATQPSSQQLLLLHVPLCLLLPHPRRLVRSVGMLQLALLLG